MTEAERAAWREELRAAVRDEVAPLFGELHRFVDRRVAELSAEVVASVELADMTEEKLLREIATVHDQISRIVAAPAASARNSGVELEAVVQATEAAANTILAAAEAIQDWIARGQRDAAAIEGLADQVNAIFEACSFQDVTGQRIRRAIQHLQQAETVLERFLPPGTPRSASQRVEVSAMIATVTEATGPDLGQAAIDALLN